MIAANGGSNFQSFIQTETDHLFRYSTRILRAIGTVLNIFYIYSINIRRSRGVEAGGRRGLGAISRRLSLSISAIVAAYSIDNLLSSAQNLDEAANNLHHVITHKVFFHVFEVKFDLFSPVIYLHSSMKCTLSRWANQNTDWCSLYSLSDQPP